MNTRQQTNTIFFIGRLLIGGMYLMAGIGNLVELPAKLGYAASKGIVAPDVLVPLSSVLLIIAGLCFITGFQPRMGVLAAAVFLIPVTLLMHNFWAYEGMQRQIEFHGFTGNVGLLGSALMFLAIPQPWPQSVSALLTPRLRRQQGQAVATAADLK